MTWTALKAQFGGSYRLLYHFKPRFAAVLELAPAVYPEAKVDIEDNGIVLHPSRPPVAPRQLKFQ